MNSTANPLLSPSSHPEASPAGHSSQVNQERGEAILLWLVGAFCIFGWEYFLCLPDEYNRVWKRPLTATSYLYLANRYFGILQLCFVVSLGANAWNRGECKHMYYWEPVGALVSTVLSQMILGTRVYAIYGKSKWIATLLITVLVTEIGIGGFAISTTGLPPVPPGPQKPPCGSVIGSGGWFIAFWSIPLFYDALAFLLTAWKAYQYWVREINTPLFTVIWRDGILYFFAIFTMNALNIIIFMTFPKILRPINLTPTLIFEIVLSCRLLLNLRGMNEKTSSNIPQKPTPGPTRSDPSSSTINSKPRAQSQSLDRNNPGVIEMKPQFFGIPYTRSVETFRSGTLDIEGRQFLDIGKKNSGWLRH